jgi:hypothetical protein
MQFKMMFPDRLSEPRDSGPSRGERCRRGTRPFLPAFISLGPVRLDLDRLERNAARPFDPVGEVSPLRRQWALLALGAAILTRLRLAAAIEQLRKKNPEAGT